MKNYKRQLFATALLLCSAEFSFAQEEVSANVAEKAARPVSTAVAARPLSDLYVNQWVQLRASGELVGSVVGLTGESHSPMSNARVVLVKNGQIMAEGMTNEQGQVVLPNVMPGLYTLVARGAGTIGSFSLAVLDMQAGRHLPAEFSVPVAAVGDREIGSFFASQFSPNSSVSTRAVDLTADPLGRGRNFSVRDYKISLDQEGTLHGDLARPGLAPAESGVGGMNVMLFADGREIARTTSDADGHYKFPGLKPGAYGVVATGNKGFAAVAVCATEYVADEQLSLNSVGGMRFVSAAAATMASMQTEVSNEDDADEGAGPVLEPIETPTGTPAPGTPVGPMAGPLGGAGGASAAPASGLSGILSSPLLPLAAIGGTIAAVVATDDDSPNTAAVSPANTGAGL